MEHFGRYRIDGVLGEGGLGRVHRAFDEQHARPVALKLLVRAGDERARLLAEARAAVVEHPDVVRVYDVGEVDGVGYVAMELIEGRPLRAVIGDRSVPLMARIAWLLTIARALAAGHARGIIHRGVRPENILLHPVDGPKLLEFGLARRPIQPTLGPGGAFEATAPGSSIDTPLFLAPEQIRNQTVDARADQFAWGVVAYELLTGVHPWTAARDPIAMVAAILVRPARSLREVAPDVPEPLARAIDRALLKDPGDRFPGMAELLASLDPPAPPRSRLKGLMSSQVSSAGMMNSQVTTSQVATAALTTPNVTASAYAGPPPLPGAAPPTIAPRPQWPWIVGVVVAAAVLGAALAAAL